MTGFNLTGCKAVTSITSLFTKNQIIKYKKKYNKRSFKTRHTWQSCHIPCGCRVRDASQPVTNPTQLVKPVTHS